MKSIFDTLHFYMTALLSVRNKVLKGALLAVISMMFYCVVIDYASDKRRPTGRTRTYREVRANARQ